MKSQNGSTAADLIVHSSGPPPIVLCNSLLENVLVSLSSRSLDATNLIEELTWSLATPARLRINSIEDNDADDGNRLVYVKRTYYLIAQGIRGDSAFRLSQDDIGWDGRDCICGLVGVCDGVEAHDVVGGNLESVVNMIDCIILYRGISLSSATHRRL